MPETITLVENTPTRILPKEASHNAANLVEMNRDSLVQITPNSAVVNLYTSINDRYSRNGGTDPTQLSEMVLDAANVSNNVRLPSSVVHLAYEVVVGDPVDVKVRIP